MANRPQILIIDDEVALCSLLSTMLYTQNLDVACAHSLAEADKLLNSGFSPALIFLDNVLPDGLGINHLSRLKSGNNKTAVVMITGNYDETLQQTAMQQGCVGFLEKPFSYLKVSELVEKVLNDTASA